MKILTEKYLKNLEEIKQNYEKIRKERVEEILENLTELQS